MDFLLSNKTYVACFLAPLLVVYLITPLVSRLARRLGAIDRPNHRKIHSQATPLMGGLAIYLGMWLPILALSFWDNDVTARVGGKWPQFAVVAMAGAAVMLSGILDDLRGLSVIKKLLVQVPLAVLFTMFVAHFDNINIPGIGRVDLGIWGIPLTIIWIVGITNALNLVDGIDGLATGVAFFVALTTSVLAIMGGKEFLALVMLAMAGACLGFLRYNFTPAKIFLGDTGSLFLGMTLAATSVMASSKSHVAASLLVAVIILGYPVIDTLLAMARRGLHGKSMFTPDRGHIHHRLLARGLGHSRAAMVIYVFCAALSILALAIVAQSSFAALMSLIVVTAMAALGLNFLGLFRLFQPKDIKETRARFLASHYLTKMLVAKLSVAETIQQVYALLEQACAEFHMLSLQVELDPTLIPEGQNQRHVWVNNEQAEFESDLDKTARAKEEFLFGGEGELKVRVLYKATGQAEDMSNEYLFHLSRLVDAGAVRLREMSSDLKPSAGLSEDGSLRSLDAGELERKV